jgi:glycosyl transferase family 87
MFKLNNENVSSAPVDQQQDSKVKISDNRVWRKYLLDVLIVLAMSALSINAISSQMFLPHTDPGKYQCYTLIFWNGVHGIDSLPTEQCAFIHEYSPDTIINTMKSHGVPAGLINLAVSQAQSEGPFHRLPYEYPLLSLAAFSLGLTAPTAWYQFAFAMWMLLIATVIYFVLKKTRSFSAAIAFVIYLVFGSLAIAASRFDLIPACLILGAVILAGRAKWKWAYALLALATLFKIFPVVLVVPFLIAQQMQSSDKWYSWHRWSALGVYIGICAVVTLLSLALNIADTLSPIGYFFNRPVQVESVPATLLWLGSFFGYPLHFIRSFGSANVISSLSHIVSLLSSLCLVIGLLYTFWLQWRGKLDIYAACLLTVLIILITGKVFSPQYLVWIIPLVAFVGKANWKWLISWAIVGLLTTWIWPIMYHSTALLNVPLLPAFYPAVLVRNLIILGFVIALLYQATRKSFVLNM